MFDGKSILVTGGTGSFGQACIRTLLTKHKPKKVVVFSRDEWKQQQMAEKFPEEEVRFFLGDVRDEERLTRALRDIDHVVHAAALKQVPALEYNPDEAVKTNIMGAMNVIRAAIRSDRVQSVVALSTDKACMPINLYGATKLASDKLFIAANSISSSGSPTFSVVRYGNVFGSRGSVVPFFQRLLADGATKLPITDMGMTRFFITLEEGVDFVLQSFERMWGGELFIPKLPSCKIADLARVMAPEAELEEVGIRPGEKLHEILLPSELSRRSFQFKDYYVTTPDFPHKSDLDYTKNRRGETGGSVADDFEYRSDTNEDQLTEEQLASLLANYKA